MGPSSFSSQVIKDPSWVPPRDFNPIEPPAMGLCPTLPRVALMELVNIAYEDAEKNGGSMTFEKPLGAMGRYDQ